MNSVRVLWIDCAPFCGGAQKSFGTLIRALQENYPGEIRGRLYFAEKGADSWGERLGGLPGLSVRYCSCRHWSRSLAGFFQMLADVLHWHLVLMREIRHDSPDLIHVNCCRAYLLLPWLFCRKISVVIHDRDIRKPKWLMRFISLKKRLQVFAVSQWLAEDWKRRFPRVLCRYLPNPVQTDGAGEQKTPAELPVFALIADWTDWKNHPLFIRALAEFRKKYGPCRGIIQGRCHNRTGEQLRRQAMALRKKLGLDEVLEITDRLTAAQVLDCAQVLVSCGEKEPFGRTVVEALQWGLTVVARETGGPAEILQDCAAGFLSSGNPADFADRMQEARENSGRPEVTAAALVRGGRYLPEMVVGGVRECYGKSVLDQ